MVPYAPEPEAAATKPDAPEPEEAATKPDAPERELAATKPDVPALEPEEAATKPDMPEEKRPRLDEPDPYSSVEPKSYIIKVYDSREKGKPPSISVFSRNASGGARLKLYNGTEERNVMPFGLGLEGPYAPPCVRGEVGKSRVESTSVTISVGKDLARWIDACETHFSELLTDHCKDIWGKSKSPAEVPTMLKRVVKVDNTTGRTTTNIKVPLFFSL
jgi:hypothetical protein